MCFVRNFLHNGNKCVQRFLAFCFCRFDHHGFVEEKREVDGRCMEAVIQQAFGNFERRDV